MSPESSIILAYIRGMLAVTWNVDGTVWSTGLGRISGHFVIGEFLSFGYSGGS
jgi:hypothetical protein